VFQAGGLVVVLVEAVRKAYLASIVPVIVNAILSEHQLVIDIVAFVSKGDFPRSRLGEKQRGKILANWVTRKMRTIAQFGIRDADVSESHINEAAEPRSGAGAGAGGTAETTPRQVELSSTPLNQHQVLDAPITKEYSKDYSLPAGISEMPTTQYDDAGFSNVNITDGSGDTYATAHSDSTATERQPSHFELPDTDIALSSPPKTSDASLQAAESYQSIVSDHAYHFMPDNEPNAPALGPPDPPPVSLPSVTGHENHLSGDLWSLPSQRGGLRVANEVKDDEEDEWPQEAIMYGNLSNSSAVGRGGSTLGREF
jgi:hypothetical protein